MGQGDSYTSAKTNPDQYRTPAKPAKPSKSKRASARQGSLTLSDPPAPASASTSTPSAASTSRSKSKKRISVRDQPTLTQIDFVTISQQPDSDDDSPFKYIGDSGQDTHDVIEIEDEDAERNNDQDEDYKLSSASRIKREHGVRFDAAPSKSKRSSIKVEETAGKGRKKSGDKKDKEKDDKTLTQMKYVRRINIEPDDDDAKLEYAYITPKKKVSERQTANGPKTETAQEQPTYISEPSSQRKRKLSPNLAGKGLHEADDAPRKKDMPPPTTPRKSFKNEILSSQSPESPGVVFITSSQFRSATRSPLKQTLHASEEPYIKKESTGSPGMKGTPKTVQTPHIDEKPSLHTRNSPHPSQTLRETAEHTSDAKAPTKLAKGSPAEMPDPKHRPKPPQRSVVYETDAESDYSEFENDRPDVPNSPGAQDTTNSYQEAHANNEPNSPRIESESQELPPPMPETQIDSGLPPSQTNLLSDASICYQRVHPDTQFPLDPVPTINTQEMAELFPEYSNGLHTLTPSPSSSPRTGDHHPPTPQVVTETQDPNQTQDQSESQHTSKTPTEIIPESSPVAHREHEDSASSDRHAPATKDVVVQVESSQPLDRTCTGHDSEPRRMLSRSQILTSSVMESIPMPAFWMSSQDSVGEPYSQPNN
ncbi:uncharacterized protein BDV17DRAFT_287576 [Aspergillus undulatus]|uniref:uncharacterized protein n=1 Tax=Aspergillus undulatus TaxID=1810928 RepID=UPI003CCCF5AF